MRLTKEEQRLVARAIASTIWPDHYPKSLKPKTKAEFAALGRIARDMDA